MNATVKNGNKNYQDRVFAIKNGAIIKSWNIDEYIKMSVQEIKSLLEIRNRVFRTKAW